MVKLTQSIQLTSIEHSRLVFLLDAIISAPEKTPQLLFVQDKYNIEYQLKLTPQYINFINKIKSLDHTSKDFIKNINELRFMLR